MHMPGIMDDAGGSPLALGSFASSPGEGSSRPLGMADGGTPSRWMPLRVETSSAGTGMGGWRDHIPSEPKAALASILVHAAVFGALMFSVNVKMPQKPETRTLSTFDVSLQPGDGMDVAIPKTSTPEPSKVEETKPEPEVQPEPQPKPDPQPQPEEQKPVEQPPQQQASSASPSETQSLTSAPSGGGLIWTPPVPRPNAAGVSDSQMRPENRIEMPKVNLPKGASDPVLLSYDQGRYSDAAAMSEASRLMNTGTITMAVTVDDKGAVNDCVVTTTSGSRMLDERACALIKSYQYRPAQDNDGKTHGAIVTEVLEWARDGKFTSTKPGSPVALEAVRATEGTPVKSGPAIPQVQMPRR